MIRWMQRHSHITLITAFALFVTAIISWQGLNRELISNSVYIQLIETFPKNLNLRTEPLYIVVLWVTSKIIGPLASIVVWRTILTWLQLFFVYRFFTLIHAPKKITLSALAMYATSAVTFGLADNLLRNYAALTLVLGLLVWITAAFRQKQQLAWWQWSLLGLLLGAIFYTHLFMAIIAVAFTGGLFGLLQIIQLVRERRVFPLPTINRGLLIVLVLGFAITSPYLYQLRSKQAGISDYRQSTNENTVVSNGTTASGDPIPVIETELTSKQKALRTFRFVFEYRDITLPLGLMVTLAITVLWTLLRHRSKLKREALLVSIFWLITLAGTKLDFLALPLCRTDSLLSYQLLHFFYS